MPLFKTAIFIEQKSYAVLPPPESLRISCEVTGVTLSSSHITQSSVKTKDQSINSSISPKTHSMELRGCESTRGFSNGRQLSSLSPSMNSNEGMTT